MQANKQRYCVQINTDKYANGLCSVSSANLLDNVAADFYVSGRFKVEIHAHSQFGQRTKTITYKNALNIKSHEGPNRPI
ncbi:hypothetical protein BpHYR1_001491 [Brachionus plicatilis]|uniref:Uncharacterized protein n=1 Tax=Brachionus plicatilis TaxID=10195 RepID=A0A3M7QE07_BRAPC|nr:hypothetical protein BpHYR1_001491 [Brachionus plicatilis]